MDPCATGEDIIIVFLCSPSLPSFLRVWVCFTRNAELSDIAPRVVHVANTECPLSSAGGLALLLIETTCVCMGHRDNFIGSLYALYYSPFPSLPSPPSFHPYIPPSSLFLSLPPFLYAACDNLHFQYNIGSLHVLLSLTLPFFLLSPPLLTPPSHPSSLTPSIPPWPDIAFCCVASVWLLLLSPGPPPQPTPAKKSWRNPALVHARLHR